MTTLHRIALLGFSAFERSTLASYFRLASTRDPRYEQVQFVPEADFVVADADHEPSVKLVLAIERLPETVFVGARAPAGAIAWLRRPIDPLRVLRELDALATRRMSQPGAAHPDAATDGQRGRTVIQPVRPRRPDPPAELLAPPDDLVDLALPDLVGPAGPPPAARATIPAATAPAPAPQASRSALPLRPSAGGSAPPAVFRMRGSASMPAANPFKPAAARLPITPRPGRTPLPTTALLVDDSDVALRFLQKKLAPFGLITECASHSEGAIRRLAQRRYDFVFLDMELGERSPLDGLGLCERIKRNADSSNVVMVTAHHTELDRVRGALAGCDGFLGKPLDEEELALYLARFGVRPAINAGGVPS